MTASSTTIWLNQTYTSTTKESNIATHLALCKCDPYLVTFHDTNECFDYIRSLKDENNKIILIISNETLPSTTFLQQIEELPQIDSVYILNSSNIGSFESTSETRTIYTCLESLCNHLSHLPNIRRFRREGFVRDDFTISELCHLHDSSTQSIASSSDTVTKAQKTEFMYAQILQDVLIQGKPTQKEMVEFCRQKFAGNEIDLRTVGEFEEYYEARNAIFWYTRDTFLYRLLNKALREQDFDTLYSLRYFIKDLDSQISEQYVSQYMNTIYVDTTDNDESIPFGKIIYRGQLMTNEEFKQENTK